MSLKSRNHASRRNPKVRADDPEPSLAELLDDPVLQLLMARDGINRADLLDVIDTARARLGVTHETPHFLFEKTLFAECRA
jgi:hypothetical protein